MQLKIFKNGQYQAQMASQQSAKREAYTTIAFFPPIKKNKKPQHLSEIKQFFLECWYA